MILLHKFKLGRNSAEATRNIMEVWGQKSISELTTRFWFDKFRPGNLNLDDKEGHGRSSQLRLIFEADSQNYKTN